MLEENKKLQSRDKFDSFFAALYFYIGGLPPQSTGQVSETVYTCMLIMLVDGFFFFYLLTFVDLKNKIYHVRKESRMGRKDVG